MKKFNALRYLLWICLISLLARPGFSADPDKVASTGNWSSAGTWTPVGVPQDGEIIQIPSGVNVTIASGNDIVLTDAQVVIQGELTVSNNLFNYSSLTINGASAGIFVEVGGTITDPSFFGLNNFININGQDFWGGQNFGGALYNGDFTAASEYAEPPGFDNPLPVTLISFDAVALNGKVILEWATGSERDNVGFEIEKSTDGQFFDVIGFVEGHGTTASLNTYSFEDYAFSDTYYRYKQIDFDGKFEYSPLRFISVDKRSDEFSIYPNPTRGAISIKGALTNYALYNQTGKLLLDDTNTTAFYAEGEISEILAAQVQGIYFLKTVLNGQLKVVRIIKE